MSHLLPKIIFSTSALACCGRDDGGGCADNGVDKDVFLNLKVIVAMGIVVVFVMKLMMMMMMMMMMMRSTDHAI